MADEPIHERHVDASAASAERDPVRRPAACRQKGAERVFAPGVQGDTEARLLERREA